MFRLIFGLILLSASSLAAAGSCTVINFGPYLNGGAASADCAAAYGQGCAYNVSAKVYGYYETENSQNGSTTQSTSVTFCTTELHEALTRTAYNYHVEDSCPSGTADDGSGQCMCSDGSEYNPNTGQCGNLPSCDGPGDPAGSVYDSQSESCGCPSGQTDYLATDGSYSCVKDLEECSASAEGFLGYVNNTPVCSYQDDCGAGTTGGVVNGDWMCVDEPQCDGGTWINGACIFADDREPSPNPEGEFENKDTDGDGVPDSSDSDIDGDGIPNGQDDDVDGDGVLNVDDQTNEKDSSASGGNSCDAAPVCSGDAVQCAILQQQWLTRCGTENSYSESSCSVEPSCSGDALACESLINEWEYQCSLASSENDAEGFFESAGFKTADDYAAEGGVFGAGEEEDLSTVTSSVLSSRSTIVGSCPAPKTVNAAPFGQFEIQFTPFCDLADMIYWIVMLSAYLTATFIIFRSITN